MKQNPYPFNINKYCLLLLLVLVFYQPKLSFSQDFRIHSHNDYLNDVPFWEAYASESASIEADVILKGNTLYVAHEPSSIIEEQTLQSLYLDPILKAKELKLGRGKPFILLIDFKTEAYATMEKLLEVLPSYSTLWENTENPFLKIVISGNRPKTADYRDYPFPLFFDYQSITETENLPLDKIAMFSLNFRNLSQWNGKGRLIDEDRKRLLIAIEIAHQFQKPIRFWATPDSKTAWKSLKELGVDYINTDQPYEAKKYLSNLNERLYISSNIREIYKPTFEKDGQHSRVKNVILMVGDGNGLAQIGAAMYANNNQLTLTNLKNMGLIKTQALDDFTTDSAAAGTALATGYKVKNRSIGSHPDGSSAKNLPEYLSNFGFHSGIITTDNITGATPAAFYAHRNERDMIKEIASDLAQSKLNLFIGGGKNDFLRYGANEIDNLKEAGFQVLSSLGELNNSKAKRVGYFASNQNLPKVLNGRKGYLKEATNSALSYFSNHEKPFFLMVEGAFIDSGGHLNEAPTVIEEGMDFDEAIEAALMFADQDGETLVIITADHETGGLTIPQGNASDNQVELEFSTEDHTGILVPVFAYGPHSGDFRGIYENTEIFHKITALVEKYAE